MPDWITFDARPDDVVSASAGGAATSDGAGTLPCPLAAAAARPRIDREAKITVIEVWKFINIVLVF